MQDRKITVQLPTIGTSLLITLIFVLLRIIGVIHWNWVWLISPIWLPYLFAFIFSFIIMIYYKITGKI